MSLRGGGVLPPGDERAASVAGVARLDETARALQGEGRFPEALDCLERGLVLRLRLYGAGSSEVWAACKAAGELANLLAMAALRREDYAGVSAMLKKAEVLTERDPGGRAVTYNNWACFARQQGKLQTALAYLTKALKLEERLRRVDAHTHLNLCAVLSQLGRHEEALVHAQAAMNLLQEELFGGAGAAGGAGGGAPAPESVNPERVAVLAIAYHNLGVEHEFARQFMASLSAYTKGVEVASVYLGPEHSITATLRASQLGAAKAIESANAALKRKEGAAAAGGRK